MPVNTFGMTFGLAGLALLWNSVHKLVQPVGPLVVASALLALVVWLVVLTGYLLKALRCPTAVRAELTGEVPGPFAALAPITGMALGSVLYQWVPRLGWWMVVLGAVGTLLYGGWLAGEWIVKPLRLEQIHPGYFLPTVAGGLVACSALHTVGLTSASYLGFGIGVVCWFVIGSVVLNRLFVGPELPAALVPLLAIEVAPPAVAGNAWFAIRSGPPDPVQLALAGYTLLMVIVQLRLIPRYRRVRFQPSFWAFAFSYTSVALYGARWLVLTDPPGAVPMAWTLVVGVSVFVGWVGWRTVRELVAGRYFPPPVRTHD